MTHWAKVVKVEDAKEGVSYFIGRGSPNPNPAFANHWHFYATDINGKRIMSIKPGIADRFKVTTAIKTLLQQNPDLKLIEIPADAHKRWKARAKRR